jgi:uncharacterized membrane protein YuzA (DUF378 family)
MKNLKLISLILVIIGGLNWGLVGLLKLNLVTAIVGKGIIADIIYILVGLAAVYLCVIFKKLSK